MKATTVMNIGTLKYFTKKKESYNIEKTLKDLYQLGTSTNYKSKHKISGCLEKLKLK